MDMLLVSLLHMVIPQSHSVSVASFSDAVLHDSKFITNFSFLLPKEHFLTCLEWKLQWQQIILFGLPMEILISLSLLKHSALDVESYVMMLS